jgi:DGQHR domain-containing protein
MPSVTVQRFRQRFKGEPIDLYLAAVPAEEVIHRKRMDVRSVDNPGGYQRRPEGHRLIAIANYVLRGEGLLPTALLVNIREGAWFEESPSGGDFGTLHFSDDQPWWVEDGQHRTLGVKEAFDKAASARKPIDLGYDLPVVFCLNFNRTREMELFRIVNSKAKGVPTDLVASIVHDHVMQERAKDDPHVRVTELRKAAGVAIGNYLSDFEPWKGHIQEVNEPKDLINKPMQANTFASTLMPVLRDRWVKDRFLVNSKDPQFGELSKLVLTYWRVLAELMPEAFDDIAHHSIQRPIGVYSFHELLLDVMDECRMENNWRPDSIKRKLERLAEWVDSPTWHRENGADIIKGSGNRAAIRIVVERMRVLYREPLTGLPE